MVEQLIRIVETWRKNRAPELAEAAIALGAQIDAGKPPLSKAKQKDWLALAAAKQPEELGRLLATLFTSTPPVVKARLDAIATWPDDPRTSAAIAAYCGAPTFDRIGKQWRAVYQQALAQLVKLADPASAAPMLALVKLREDVSNDRKDLSDSTKAEVSSFIAVGRFGRTTEQQIDAAAKLLSELPRPKLTAAQHEALPSAKAVAKTAKGDGGGLLAEIYANPGDDSLRLAYADWLQEQGDPRGELIALQCQRKAGKPSARERKLLATYERAWLGEIEPAVQQAGVRFERGFLAAARYTNLKNEPFVGHPSWSTVEEIELTRDSFDDHAVALLQHPVMRSLRTVRSARSGVFAELLASKPPLAIETFQIHNVEPFDEILPRLAKQGLPRLNRLEIELIRPELVVKLLGSALGKQLTELVAGIGHVEPADVETVVTAVRKLSGLALTSLQLTHAKQGGWRFELTGKKWPTLGVAATAFERRA